LIVIVEPAPSSLPPAKGTGIGGVPTATESVNGSGARLTNGGVGGVSRIVGPRVSAMWAGALAGLLGWVMWRVVE
jgi:hypothetical protein